MLCSFCRIVIKSFGLAVGQYPQLMETGQTSLADIQTCDGGTCLCLPGSVDHQDVSLRGI